MRGIKIGLGFWIAYWALLLVLPLNSSGDFKVQAFCYQLLFVGLMFGAAFLSRQAFEQKSSSVKSASAKPVPVKPWVVNLSLLLAIFGTYCLVYDKVFIQHIDYVRGLAQAHFQWIDQGASRPGPSSIYSVMGYIFSSCYCFTTFALLRRKSPRVKPYIVWPAIVVLVFINTMLVGGRSPLFLFLLVYGASSYSVSGNGDIATSRRRMMELAVFAAAMVYYLYVFGDRAHSGNKVVADYALMDIGGLGMEVSPYFLQILPHNAFGSFVLLALLGAAYFTHSFTTMAQSIGVAGSTNHVLTVFSSPFIIGQKLFGTPVPNLDWVLSGKFIPLPGALYVSWGAAGLVAFAIIYGLLFGYLGKVSERRDASLMVSGLYVLVLTTIMASPIVPLFDALFFPSVLLQFLYLGIIAEYAEDLPRSIREGRDAVFSWQIRINGRKKPSIQERDHVQDRRRARSKSKQTKGR